MSFFDYVTDGASQVCKGAHWLWQNAPTGTFTAPFVYASNTTFQILDQISTLREAIPSLLLKESSRNIANCMTYLVVYDVLPVVAVNFVNNHVQAYFQAEEGQEDLLSTPYTVFLYGLVLVDFSVKAYSLRQGAQSVVRITVLDAVAPAAFNKDVARPPITVCDKEECTFKRKMKGWVREPIILATNDLLVSMLGRFAYGGPMIAGVARVFFNGRYIIRAATPEVCERHKFLSMQQETVLALGVSFAFTSSLMEHALEATVGMPPLLTHRTLRHILLLFHSSVAAHMRLPIVDAKNATLPVDPFTFYEWVCRFSADVAFSGLRHRIPIDFKRPEGKEPWLTLPKVFATATQLLNEDALSIRQRRTMLSILLPPALQSTDGFVNDPIVAANWLALREKTVTAISFIKRYGTRRDAQALSHQPLNKIISPSKVAMALNVVLGLPKSMTIILLTLCPIEDFWKFLAALEGWFNRHQVKVKVAMAEMDPSKALHGDKKVEVAPDTSEQAPVVPATSLLPDPKDSKSSVANAALIASTRDSDSKVVPVDRLVTEPAKTAVVSVSSHSLFSTRPRNPAATTDPAAMQVAL